MADDSIAVPPIARESLACRMKTYEAEADFKLDSGLPAIIRLDGHGFSKFTSRFKKPFDERLHTAMVRTSADLVNMNPGATLAYTQSDEITLVFPNGIPEFNGRVQKIGSLAASSCSVAFLKHLGKAFQETPLPHVPGFNGQDDEGRPLPHFDARVFNVPTLEECVNNLIWRCKADAVRNSVSSFARSLFSTKQMHKKTTEDLIRMAKDEKGVEYYDTVPRWALAGSLVKREQYAFDAIDRKTGEIVMAMRTRLRVEDRGLQSFSRESVRLVEEKYWRDD